MQLNPVRALYHAPALVGGTRVNIWRGVDCHKGSRGLKSTGRDLIEGYDLYLYV